MSYELMSVRVRFRGAVKRRGFAVFMVQQYQAGGDGAVREHKYFLGVEEPVLRALRKHVHRGAVQVGAAPYARSMPVSRLEISAVIMTIPPSITERPLMTFYARAFMVEKPSELVRTAKSASSWGISCPTVTATIFQASDVLHWNAAPMKTPSVKL